MKINNSLAWLIASLIMILIGIISLSTSACANEEPNFEKLVDAIYKAEGGQKAKKPFGILSVPCEGFQACRKVCLNTVRNNWKRWEAKSHNAHKYPDYLSFLASRYAPVGGIDNDPTNLNRHWLKNVSYFYHQI